MVLKFWFASCATPGILSAAVEMTPLAQRAAIQKYRLALLCGVLRKARSSSVVLECDDILQGSSWWGGLQVLQAAYIRGEIWRLSAFLPFGEGTRAVDGTATNARGARCAVRAQSKLELAPQVHLEISHAVKFPGGRTAKIHARYSPETL